MFFIVLCSHLIWIGSSQELEHAQVTKVIPLVWPNIMRKLINNSINLNIYFIFKGSLTAGFVTLNQEIIKIDQNCEVTMVVLLNQFHKVSFRISVCLTARIVEKTILFLPLKIPDPRQKAGYTNVITAWVLCLVSSFLNRFFLNGF